MSHNHPAAEHRKHPYWRGAAIFAVIAGAAILINWIYLFATNNVPELDGQPVTTWVRIITEVATAVLLLAAGYGLAAGAPWARKVYLIAVGALLFAVVHAVAIYGQKGDLGMVVLALLLAVIAFFFAMRSEE
ncbi:MAG: hypothetical protein J0H63_05800 [Rhizobiales bacterium]|nr:hypothetical protein [Hyphomicrobiales bacterium]MBN9009659.1 hypothetical protein [Hyphomicrobiales bacterium]